MPLLVLALLLLIRLLDPQLLEPARLRWFDQLQRLLPAEGSSGRVVLVAVDNASLEAYGQWPWPRDRVAALVRELTRLDAAAVAFDVLFAEPDRLSPASLAEMLDGADPATREALRALGDNDRLLVEAVAAVPTVAALALDAGPDTARAPPPSRFAVRGEAAAQVLARLPDFRGVLTNMPPLQAAAAGAGIINVFPEPDGVVRRIPGALRVEDTLQPGLAVETARLALGADGMVLEARPLRGAAGIGIGDRFLPTDRLGRLWLDVSAPGRVPIVSAADLLRGAVPADRIAGRLAVIGVTGVGIGDSWQTPPGRILPGAVIQALALDTLLTGRLPRRPLGIVAAEIVLTAVAGLLLVAGLPRLRARHQIWVLLALTAVPFLVSLGAFAAARSLVDAVFPGLAVLVLGVEIAYAGFRREERERQAQEAAAALAMRRLRDAIESIAEGFALFGPDRRLVLCNAPFRALLGPAAAAAAPGAAYEAVMTALAGSEAAPVSARADPAAWVAARAAAFGADAVTREEPDGRGRWIRIEERRTLEDGLVALYTDVTEARAREADLDRARRQAEEASRAKSDILANMSHELRTPLNAIIGFSEIMRHEMFGPLGQPTYRDYANDIYGSASHLLDLISQMLDLSRIEMGQMRLDETIVDLGTLADTAARLVTQPAAVGGLTLTVERGEAAAAVRADRRMMLQILLNLLSNAVKFTEPGGRITVRVVRRDDGWLGFAVSDTGIGMSEAVLSRAVERFWEGSSEVARTRGGAGLGLALVKSFADLHGGRLDLDSVPGRGTTVTVLLPPDRVVHRQPDEAGTP